MLVYFSKKMYFECLKRKIQRKTVFIFFKTNYSESHLLILLCFKVVTSLGKKRKNICFKEYFYTNVLYPFSLIQVGNVYISFAVLARNKNYTLSQTIFSGKIELLIFFVGEKISFLNMHKKSWSAIGEIFLC